MPAEYNTRKELLERIQNLSVQEVEKLGIFLSGLAAGKCLQFDTDDHDLLGSKKQNEVAE